MQLLIYYVTRNMQDMGDWLKDIAVNSKVGARRTYMLICIHREDSDGIYCIINAEKSELKSDENYRETYNNKHITFKILRDLFIMNSEFKFDLQWGAN